MPETQGHFYGELESMKFDHLRSAYRKYMEYIKGKNPPVEDILDNPASYIGHMTMNRMLTIYELYKKRISWAYS